MGQTRIILNHINELISEHSILKREKMQQYCADQNLEKYYRNLNDVHDQKFEQKFRKIIDQHIQYLEEKDPYGREPLWGAEAKKQLFLKLRQDLEPLHGEQFIQKLGRSVASLEYNPIIDQRRWPDLKLDNMFHFFKSLFSNKTAYSENNTTHKKNRK